VSNKNPPDCSGGNLTRKKDSAALVGWLGMDRRKSQPKRPLRHIRQAPPSRDSGGYADEEFHAHRVALVLPNFTTADLGGARGAELKISFRPHNLVQSLLKCSMRASGQEPARASPFASPHAEAITG
jgi:hypothetical protein